MSEQRALADLIASEAPVGARRATAITLAIVDELVDLTRNGQSPGRFSPAQVHLGSDGSVAFDEPPGNDLLPGTRPENDEWTDTAPSAQPTECSASVGLVLFELLMARAPVDTADAFEPGITSTLTPTLSALIVRSVSDSPAQWPTLDLWVSALAAQAEGSATPPPAARQLRDRKRTVASIALLVTLAAITIFVISRVPQWWDNATSDEGSPAAGHEVQFERASS